MISSCNPIQKIYAHVIGLLSRPLAEILSVKLAKLEQQGLDGEIGRLRSRTCLLIYINFKA